MAGIGSALPPPPQPDDPAGARYCLDCHYPLYGLSRNACPECGRPFLPYDPKTFAWEPRPTSQPRRLHGEHAEALSEEFCRRFLWLLAAGISIAVMHGIMQDRTLRDIAIFFFPLYVIAGVWWMTHALRHYRFTQWWYWLLISLVAGILVTAPFGAGATAIGVAVALGVTAVRTFHSA